MLWLSYMKHSARVTCILLIVLVKSNSIYLLYINSLSGCDHIQGQSVLSVISPHDIMHDYNISSNGTFYKRPMLRGLSAHSKWIAFRPVNEFSIWQLIILFTGLWSLRSDCRLFKYYAGARCWIPCWREKYHDNPLN